MQVTTEQLDELRSFDTPTVASALSRLRVRPLTSGYASAELRCLFAGLPPIVGFAVTCREDTTTPIKGAGRGDEDLFRAIGELPAPSIVVTQDIGMDRMRSCHLGDGMAMAMQRLGAVGFMTDGAIRDVEGIRTQAEGFQVFAAGVVAASGQPNVIDVGQPVSIYGMQVNSGDLLHADANGALTIPLDTVSAVIDKAHEVVAFERERAAYLTGPEFSLEGWLAR